MMLPNISEFISNYITERNKSFFYNDVKKYENSLIKEIKNKSVLVIGGAGTIGSSFIAALLKFNPKELVVVDTNENGLTELTRSLRSDGKVIMPKKFLTYPMSFNSTTFYKMFANHGKFDIVANFAAHKHVRSEKDFFSVEAMIKNNVLDAKKLLDFLCNYKPNHFFCVSTDKAANPVNVMGASKKLMENLIMSYSKKFKITTARFANVAFSNGSLLDGYIQRLLKQQPISCPKDVKRFFVSPEESGEICMITCIIGNSGDIFFPKLKEKDLISFKKITEDFFSYLGREIKVCKSEDEAKDFAKRISNYSPYPVYFFTTDTSGEKLYEEFFCKDDEIDLLRFGSIGVIKNSKKLIDSEMNDILKKIELVFSSKNYKKEEVIILMKSVLSDFKHIETGKYLDQKM